VIKGDRPDCHWTPASRYRRIGLLRANRRRPGWPGKIEHCRPLMKDNADRPAGRLVARPYPRARPRDAFVAPTLSALDQLPQGAWWGTPACAPRSSAPAPTEVVEFRGNVANPSEKARRAWRMHLPCGGGLEPAGTCSTSRHPINDTTDAARCRTRAIASNAAPGDIEPKAMSPRPRTPTDNGSRSEGASCGPLDGSCGNADCWARDADGDYAAPARRKCCVRRRSEALSAGNASGPISEKWPNGCRSSKTVLAQGRPRILLTAHPKVRSKLFHTAFETKATHGARYSIISAK